jgi:hypothetical protein
MSFSGIQLRRFVFGLTTLLLMFEYRRLPWA